MAADVSGLEPHKFGAYFERNFGIESAGIDQLLGLLREANSVPLLLGCLTA